MQPFLKVRQGSLSALGPYLHLAVLGISHPTLQAQQPGLTQGRVAEADALNFAFDKGVKGFQSKSPWEALLPCREFLAARIRSTAV
jgi:hypothetical protein